jgi:hypothetical protein
MFEVEKKKRDKKPNLTSKQCYVVLFIGSQELLQSKTLGHHTENPGNIRSSRLTKTDNVPYLTSPQCLTAFWIGLALLGKIPIKSFWLTSESVLNAMKKFHDTSHERGNRRLGGIPGPLSQLQSFAIPCRVYAGDCRVMWWLGDSLSGGNRLTELEFPHRSLQENKSFEVRSTSIAFYC